MYSLEVITEFSRMSPILRYLQTGELPLDEGEARRIQKQATKYTLISGKLYKIGRDFPMLRWLGKNETAPVLVEVHMTPVAAT